MPPVEVRLSISCFNRRELALKDGHKEVATATGRLEKPGVDTLGLSLYQIEHVFNEPPWCEHFPMVGNTLLGSDQGHVVRLAAPEARTRRPGSIVRHSMPT
jgi:hypothetical protein